MSRYVSALTSPLSRYRAGRVVRPWALAAPILVLVIALPLLRPLRHPEFPTGPTEASVHVSDDEAARLATIQAIVEYGTLSIDRTPFTTTARKIEVQDRSTKDYRWYSDQPPTMSVLLAGPYWVMHYFGLSFQHDVLKVTYLLTLIGVTIPAACAAGLIYRMGRLFELSRPWRALLAMAAVLGTGLISYATVLNPHVPAAALVLSAAACLIHVTLSRRKLAKPVWVGLAGFCAALAAAIDPAALPFLALFVCVAFAIGSNVRWRLGNVLAYAAGFAIPLWLHAALTVPVTYDIGQGMRLHPQDINVQGLAQNDSLFKQASQAAGRLTRDVRAVATTASDVPPAAARPSVLEDDDDQSQSMWASFGRMLGRWFTLLFGQHGVFSHFPVLLLGAAGVGMVMHRHWPRSAKVMATATLVGAGFLVIVYASRPDGPDGWRDAMFASRWLIVFGPLLLFWAGAWLRRTHRPLTWAVAAAMLAFSITVSLFGAVAGPMPHDGFDRYTAAGAVANLMHPPNPMTRPVLANR